ncbi:MAG: hypothetical protein GF409_03865 [Candidatus Omnitrophica bacterium]|nr:hypothetical protein [Candidatus Omnitrophota bacterium]
MIHLKKEQIFKGVLLVWLLLWGVFLIRQEKDGQYSSLLYAYTHTSSQTLEHIYGSGLYQLAIYCEEKMSGGSTYKTAGFGTLSLDEVRLRYLLWPYRKVERDADYIVMHGGADELAGYKKVGEAGNGTLWVKRSADRWGL